MQREPHLLVVALSNRESGSSTDSEGCGHPNSILIHKLTGGVNSALFPVCSRTEEESEQICQSLGWWRQQ